MAFFFFLIPSSFLSFFKIFFLPSFLSFFIPSSLLLLFIYFLNFKLKKIPCSFLSFFLFLFLLSSLLPPLPFFSSFPTGETIKPGAVKRPELDPNRGHPNNRDSETNFTLLLQRTCKVRMVNTITPAARGNPPTKEPPIDNSRRR